MVAQQEITIYHAAPTRSSRVVLLLEELGLPYKAVSVDFPNELFTPAFLKVNPMGTIPYFIDGDIKLSESLAIMYYLLDKYGAQQHACSSAKQKYRSRDIQVNGCTVYERIERPFGVSIAHHHRCQAATGNGKLEPAKSDISNRAQFYEGMAFFEGALASKEVPFALLALMYPEDKKDPVVAEYMKTGALKACDEIETRFFGDGRAYVAGPDFTAADIVAGHSLFVAKFRGFITEEKHPKTLAYLDKVMQRPAFQKVFLPPKEA